jgi:hypothetical protein
MKKTVFALALLVGIAFSISTYANMQDQPSTQKTETVKQGDEKKSDTSCSEKKKDEAGCKKECTKKCEKSCCKKDSKETK